ncbi:hypothetical protein [Micromonospora sp. NPDC004704]
MLVLVAMVATGCFSEPPPPPVESGMPGVWCGTENELLDLRIDGTFGMERISKTYVDEMLGDGDYVDGYRLRTEFGNVAPTSGSGSWDYGRSIQGLPFVGLEFERLDEKTVTEGVGFGIEWDDDQRAALVIYHGSRDNGWRSWFRKCDEPVRESGA